MTRHNNILSTHYLVMQNDKPSLVNAVAWHGLLWDAETHLPLIDQDKLAALPADKQESVRAILDIPKEKRKDPCALMRWARSLACQFNRNLPPEEKTAVKKEFYPLASIAKTSLLAECAIPVPSSLPVPHKLITGHYEFNAQELRDLSRSGELLRDIGAVELVQTLSKAGFLDSPAEGLPAASESLIVKPRDPLEIITRWYGIERVKHLPHHVDFWGGAENFLDFLAKRSAWTKLQEKMVIQQLNITKPPKTSKYDAAAWQHRIRKQMKGSFSSKNDLMRLYPHLDEVEGFSRSQGIMLHGLSPDRLVALSPRLNQNSKAPTYQHDEDSALLAKFCEEFRLTDKALLAAINTMQRASDRDNVPDIHIDGMKFSLDGTEIVKLPKGDPRHLFAGAMVQSCGHIGGTKKKVPLVKAAVTNPDVSTYALRDKDSQRILGKTIAWLTSEDTGRDLVLNSWHFHPDITLSSRNLQTMLLQIAEAVQRIDPHIGAIYFGKRPQQNLNFQEVNNLEGAIAPVCPELRTKDTNHLFVIHFPACNIT
jgi:hypothetical protein